MENLWEKISTKSSKVTWTILPSQIGSTSWGSSSISLLKYLVLVKCKYKKNFFPKLHLKKKWTLKKFIFKYFIVWTRWGQSRWRRLDHGNCSRRPLEDISRTPEDWTKIVILIVFVILIIIMIAIVVIVGKIFIAAALWRIYLTLSWRWTNNLIVVVTRP